VQVVQCTRAMKAQSSLAAVGVFVLFKCYQVIKPKSCLKSDEERLSNLAMLSVENERAKVVDIFYAAEGVQTNTLGICFGVL